MNKFSLKEFFEKYPDDGTCLEEIKNIRWPDGITCPDCDKVTKFYKVTGRTAYACEFGGYQIFPLAGTVLEKTTTPLQYWFYAMYLITKTRSGISAKQLQRELGVTYKTAWRMFKQIRLLMAEASGGSMGGIVEADETFVGGKSKNRASVWTHLKRGIFGVYRVVSAKYLQSYADEYSFRYNHRKLDGDMFYALLKQVANVRALKA